MMRNSFATSVFLILLAFTAFTRAEPETNTLRKAIAETRRDVKKATDNLNSLREEISQEKAPLSKEMNALKRKVRRLREEVESERDARLTRVEDVATLEKEVDALENDQEFIQNAIKEYRRALETRAGVAEIQKLEPKLEEIGRMTASASETGLSTNAVASLFDLTEEWVRTGFRSRVVAGSCLDSAGNEIDGRFALAGPLQYFSGSEASGIVIQRPGSSSPSIYTDLQKEDLSAIEGLIATGDATVPVEVSGGNALKSRKARKSLVEHIRDGGFTMYPLLAIGALSLILAIWKFLSLAFVRTEAPDRIAEVADCLRKGDAEQAGTAAAGIGRPLRAIVMEGINHRDATREQIEEVMHERVLTTVPVLRRYLGALAVFGAVAPLLGLLGTVTGMIHTFQLVTIFGTGDAKMLSGGISEALVTTETGLAIAIPVLLIHAYLSRRVSNMAGELEHSVVEFVNALKTKGGQSGDGGS